MGADALSTLIGDLVCRIELDAQAICVHASGRRKWQTRPPEALHLLRGEEESSSRARADGVGEKPP